MLSTYDKSKNNRTLFNSGSLTGILVEGSRITRSLTRPTPYGDRTIGFSRFYKAKGEDVRLSKLVSIPEGDDWHDIKYVQVQNYRSGRKEVFKVVQVQDLFDSAPPAILLSLEDVKTPFEDIR